MAPAQEVDSNVGATEPVVTRRREVKILMRLPDGRNVATRQAVHGSAPCARTEVTGRWLGTAADALALAINAGSTFCGAQLGALSLRCQLLLLLRPGLGLCLGQDPASGRIDLLCLSGLGWKPLKTEN